jgi:hypothetical protein
MGTAGGTAATASDPAGDRVRFTGTLTGNPPSYPAQAGVRGSDAALLARQGAHLTVSTTRISVQR